MRRSILIVLLAVVAVAVSPGSLWAQSSAEQLANAKRLFDALNYEQAAIALDQIVAGAPTPPIRDAALAAQFATAYDLRARSRFFLGDVEGAKSDFRALLHIAPGYAPAQVSARVKAVFDEIAKASVGRIVLTLTPSDADVELDGVPLAVVGGPVAVTAGPHTVSARRSGCRPASQEVTVPAGAAQEVALALERVSASLQLVTVPAGAEVLVDGAPRGRTEPGPLPAAWAEWPAKLGLSADTFSKPLVLDDLPQGAHVIRLQQACRTPVERRVSIEAFDDYRIEPIKMERAVASVVVETPVAGASVLLDGELRGAAPLVLEDVCEGSHVVEVRTAGGRHVERITARTGEKMTVQAAVRPAVALLAVTGLPEGYRGPDPRLALERALAGTRSITIFAPPAEKVQQALKGESLSPGWLAFDKARRPLGAGASAITDAARLDLARRVARQLEVQGVAEATLRPGTERNQYLLTILSSESAQPDVLDVTLENPPSINAAVLRLDAAPAFYRPSLGVSVADVLDVSGAVVIALEGRAAAARPGLAVGDLIVKVGDQPVVDAAAFAAALAGRNANDKLVVEARDRTGAVKRAELTVAMAPRLLAMSDETWTFNSLVLGLRNRLMSGGQADDAVVRLHLAVSLMRVGNWADARAELSRVQLPPGPGVSDGTVKYLAGLCHEAMGQPAEAEQAWRAAAADADSLLTEDGPAIKELAERKLAGLKSR